MSEITKAGAIAGVNLRRLFRDRTGAFFVLVFPFLIILALGATFGTGFTPTLGVVPADGPTAVDLVERLERADGLDVERFTDADAVREAVEREAVDAGIVLAPDHDEIVRSGGTAPVTFVARTSGESAEVRAAVAAAIDEQSVAIVAARLLVAEGLADDLDPALEAGRAAADRTPRVEVAVRAASDDVIGFDQGAAQQLILFMFVTSLSASSMLIETRRFGVSRRMLASPTRARTVLLGEALGRFAIAVFQGVLIVAGTALLFRVDWGNPLTTGVVVALFAVAGTGAAMLLGSVLRNAAQAGGLGVFLGLVLAALGGCMVPLEIFPPTMVTIAHATPHAWAIDALTGSLAGDSPAAVAGPLAVLAAYGAVLLVGATILFRRILTRA